MGHLVDSDGKAYIGPSQQLDVEMEFAFFLGKGIERYQRVSIAEAEDHIFGVVLLNDWSSIAHRSRKLRYRELTRVSQARDVQAFEDHPFAAFNAKSFASTISPWVVSLDALETYRTKAAPQDPSDLLPYLTDSRALSTFDISINMSWRLSPEGEIFNVSTSNLTNAYWSFAQMLTHHAFGGCEMRTGDLIGTGTITGEDNDSICSLVERTRNGTQQIQTPAGNKRYYVQDEDEVVFTGWAGTTQVAPPPVNDFDLALLNFSPQSNNNDGSPHRSPAEAGGGSVASQASLESNDNQTDLPHVFRDRRNTSETLDGWPATTTFLLGDTGESDPYLLRHFSSDCLDASDDIAKVTSRHILRTSDPDVMHSMERPLIMSMADHSLYDRGEPRLDQRTLDEAADEVSRMVSEETGVRLVKLFFRYIYPYFPILSRTRLLYPLAELPGRLRALPLSLKSAIYASALAFITYDDVLATTIVHSPPSSQRLYRIAWLAVTHEVHTPHLSTLQSCLLLLQRVNDDRYVMDTVFRWSLLGWTVALAQSFGLSNDCLDWNGIPDWEKRLRRRLWWAVFVMDKWAFMSAGLTSHIHKDNYDVLPLTAADFGSAEMTSESTSFEHNTSAHFYHLSRLTAIISDIQSAFFTVAASKRTQRDFALSIDLAKPFRQDLKEWKTSYDSFIATQAALRGGDHSQSRSLRSGLDGNASLGLSYLVANIILFRALLRPVESNLPEPTNQQLPQAGRDAVRAGAKTCCVEAVVFVESLQRNVWDAFWHSWSRAGFAMVSSLMIRLLITSDKAAEVDEFNALIRRWRWALRTGGGSAGNVLMSLALLRLDRSLVTRGIHESDEDE
ncbi:hypothetical protein LTR47_007283 [Exophiala xenobiotica]|nr:hypothetical protein LTR47_007283 [Exophiala xenobiotica]KAK5254038.1 hypothetical protein LTS06_001525 [Exophiala xenobiotica]KAK5260612.1 hypothetical protein LTR40_003825 [Exophiala xenobiotica]KAK5351998.1 hypothetical protein LTR61_004248 [Exophiala xenobiotica]KAK5360222.1 hypothetical protein LTS13_010312 [Exophiala xenobiotica]